MIRIKNILKNNKGSIVSDLLIFTFVLMFIILPFFSIVLEQHILLLKGQALRDAIDITNIAVYNAMDIEAKAETVVVAGRNESERLQTENRIKDIFKPLLALNLDLNNDLTPNANSLVDGKVVIESIEIFPTGLTFPIDLPEGDKVNCPSVYSIVKVPIRPNLFWNVYRYFRNIAGDGLQDFYIRVITELPENN